MIMLEVRAELSAHGWDRNWPAAPAEAMLPGRWPGSRDRGSPEKVPVRLPTRLIEQVRSAYWHTSAEAIGLLRNWHDPMAARTAAEGPAQTEPGPFTQRRL
ncbi:hypothetical protein [Streptacidiphilus jiangxiensis]|uniref:hypothetical protein n=1 Tax=Streptacidiphilus jiangxiensis TaxID=235985 RepID=UPI000693566F|nr:hypothetical protein [Streptacidiphilus jiangxiensis]